MVVQEVPVNEKSILLLLEGYYIVIKVHGDHLCLLSALRSKKHLVVLSFSAFYVCNSK